MIEPRTDGSDEVASGNGSHSERREVIEANVTGKWDASKLANRLAHEANNGSVEMAELLEGLQVADALSLEKEPLTKSHTWTNKAGVTKTSPGGQKRVLKSDKALFYSVLWSYTKNGKDKMLDFGPTAAEAKVQSELDAKAKAESDPESK